MFKYSDARPNETKIIDYFEEVGADWENVAKSLLGYLSDDDVKDWAEREEYDIFEEETQIRYYVCGIGYDANGCVMDYDRHFGDFDNQDDAEECFETSVEEAQYDIDMFFRDNEPVAYWHIQLEKCEETENEIRCIDILNETDVYKD